MRAILLIENFWREVDPLEKFSNFGATITIPFLISPEIQQHRHRERPGVAEY